MRKAIHLRYLVDQHTFKLEPETNAQPKLIGPLIISVKLPLSTSSTKFEDLVFHISLKGSEVSINSSNGENISIKINDHLVWQRFLNQNITQFVGLIGAALLSAGKEDFLWVESDNNRKVWILGLIRSEKSFEGMLVECPRRNDLDRTFWYFRPGEYSNEKRLVYRFVNIFTLKGMGEVEFLPAMYYR
jgi:hypothetical protein